MAPLPDNSTARLFIGYTINTTRHTAVLRFGAGVLGPEAVTKARAIINAAKPMITSNSAFNEARWSNNGSDLSFPVEWGTVINGTNVATLDADEVPQFISWVGRDGTGRRVRFTLFGNSSPLNSLYRIFSSNDANVAAVLTALNTTEPRPVTINGLPPVWNLYANTGRNAYWQRKVRRTS